jgi:acetyl-CoA synthetase
MLQRLGVNWGARVFSLLGRTPSLYIAALGALKSGRVYSPLFSAFGPEPVQARMTIGDARLLITTALYYDRKVASWRGELPDLKHVLLVDRRGADLPDGTRSYQDEMAASSQSAVSAQTESEDPALLHFTSGTTGKPKGAIHVHGAVVVHHLTGRTALDLHPGDIYWCTADPGSVTGTSYGINAPLTNGVTMVVDEAEIDVNRWYGILQEQKVAVWYAPPTGIRMLMRAGSGITQGYDLSHLRFMASMGEPLNPEAVS